MTGGMVSGATLAAERLKALTLLEDIAHYNLLLHAALLRETLRKKSGFDPDEARDDHGRWTGGGGGDSSPASAGNAANYDDLIGPEGASQSPLPLLAIMAMMSGAGEAGLAAGGEAEAAAADLDWTLGSYKSPQRWANQFNKRNWTPEEITDTIENGDQFEAPNYVNKENTATRYENTTTGRFVVRDNMTKEILQISGDNFLPDIGYE